MECEQIAKTFLKNYQITETCISGFINLNDENAFLDCLKACGFSFYKRNRVIYDTCGRYKSSKIRFSFSNKIPFLGSPFIIFKSIYMRCSQDGEYKSSADKSVSKSETVSYSYSYVMFQKDLSTTKKRPLFQMTKKIGCKAFLRITYLLVFSDINVQNRQQEKREASIKIRKDLDQFVKRSETRILVEISPTKEHNHPPTTENQIIHPLLKSAIYHLVASDVKVVSVIKSHLQEMVGKMVEENKIPQPNTQNHCFYPPNEVIRYHVNMAKLALRKENLDQDVTSNLIESWKIRTNDHFYFQPCKSSINSKSKSVPLFCHQTKWQSYLLNLYGNITTVLDSAYETVSCSFPLYFLIVKTNQSFIIVGTFVLNSAHENSIEEAIQIFKTWNPNWYPKYMVCGHEDNELNALKISFPDSILNICSHRIKQSWRKWLNMCHSSESTEILVELWQALLFSKTEDEFVLNKLLMQNDNTFKENSCTEAYFYKVWYPLREKWVIAYQTHEFFVHMNMNNGIENGDEFFAYQLLKEYKNRKLSKILTLIIEQYLPMLFDNYCSYNASPLKCSELKTIPDFLIDRSINLIKHVIQRYTTAEREFQDAAIIYTANGKFMLKSTTQEEWFHVDFEDVNCTCDEFQKWRFPCIHMCSIFIFTEWKMFNLAAWYLESPLMKRDNKIFDDFNDLPDWYSTKKRRTDETEIEAMEERLTGNLTHIDEFHLLLEEIASEKISGADSRLTMLDQKVNHENTQNYVNHFQSKKNNVQEMLKSLSSNIDNLAEEDLEKCYQGLKKLQDELKLTTLASS